ncbi:biosynthetic-type acetolactate synthase large subunit [Mahella sp.]|uniref:biosynthetic-type acetolactate synthase large subunit n=1 Tax=Mahella sp. TaxID=2798721 RepID=UPI0025C2AFD0|nr:biosynthetic-type acetolactate synthase large subunit [Mahella sp.]MBZ4665541.1 acetolactate synthase, large subunit [Mahella sp.]
MKITGAEVIIKCLEEQGVDLIFGYPGGAVLPLYDALYGSNITHILPCHEQAATHAADGYARASGKVGVVFATSGPGATNTVTGIANAYMDSVPMVIFTGQVALSLLGKDSFQEVDITGITMPITKHNYIVKDAQRLPDIVREAFNIARSGRPGPVLIDVPKDIQTALLDYEPVAVATGYESCNIYSKTCMDEDELKANINQAARLLSEANSPVIYAGGGVIISRAHEELKAFAEKLKIPVVSSLMGLGGFPANHPLFLGLVGMHGSRYANYTVSNSDVLIAIGARFSDRVISNVQRFAPNAKIIHIDIDPAELGKNIRVDVPINGDVKTILKELLDMVPEKAFNGWNKQVQQWREQYKLKTDFGPGRIKPQYVVQKIYELTQGFGIVTTEVGQNQIWAAQYFNYAEPRSFISSGGLGTMGYGLPAAIGAQLARPDRRVINVAGDGSFKMNSNELSTAVKYKLPVVEVILNNHALGMVRQWQRLFYQGRFSHTTLGVDTDFVKLAQAHGAEALRITMNEEVEDALRHALSITDRPTLIECDIDNNENAYPMVAPGAGIDEIIDE